MVPDVDDELPLRTVGSAFWGGETLMDARDMPVPGSEILVPPSVGIAFATWRVLSLAGRSTQMRRRERTPLVGSKQRTSWKFFGLWRRVGDNGLAWDVEGEE